MADIKQEYKEWLAKNGVGSEYLINSYCATINVFGFWNGNRSAVRQKLAELLEKENRTHQERDQVSHLKKFIHFLSEKAKKEQALAGVKVVHETAKTSSDIDWEPVVEGKPQFGSFTDIRDGQKYKCFKIGNQIWMAENLRYEGGWAEIGNILGGLIGNIDKVSKDGPTRYSWATAMNMPTCMNKIALPAVDKEITESSVVDFDCEDSGYEGYQGLAPIGWRIPSIHDFNMLLEELSKKMELDSAVELMESLFVDEESNIYADDKSEAPLAKIWSVNEYSSDYAYAQWIGWGGCRGEANEKSDLYAVRCIKNAD